MRGATVVDEEGEDATDGFNPRAHAGRDPINWIAKSRILGFNPRAHAGRDPYEVQMALYAQGFNPRAHAGRDCPRGA